MREGMVEILDFLVFDQQVPVGTLQLDLALTPGGFGLLARGDVHHDAPELRPFPVFSAKTDKVAQPDHAAIGGDHAVFKLPVFLLGGHLPAKPDGPFAVVGMNVVLPEIRLFEPAPGRVTQQPLGLLADKGKAQAGEFGLPDNAINAVDEGLVLAHGALQSDRAEFLFGDIAKDSPGGDQLAGDEAGPQVPLDVKVLAVFGEENGLPYIGVLAGLGALKLDPALVVILRMHDREDVELDDLGFGVTEGLAPGAIDIDKAALRTDALDQVGRVLEQVAVLLFALAQPFLGEFALGGPLGLIQGAPDGWHEPEQPVLQYVIRGAGFEAFDGDFIADGAGDEEEGSVGALLARQAQGCQAAETGDHVVGKDEVKAPCFEAADEIGLVADPGNFAIRPGRDEMSAQQFGIIRTVFQQEQPSR